jgi:hypothetical protein
MIQTFVDRAIFKQFFLDGHEISAFNRMKHEYDISKDDINSINNNINRFEEKLKKWKIELIKTVIDWKKIHNYCMVYRLETPDAIHLSNAIDNKSSFVVTTDNIFKRIDISNPEILDPYNLITKTSLRKK